METYNPEAPVKLETAEILLPRRPTHDDFLTGATGYLGSYIANDILTRYPDRLAVLVRAKSMEEPNTGSEVSQLHMNFGLFRQFRGADDVLLGDIAQPALGLDASSKEKLVTSMGSVIHCAASLNRKSEKTCLNVNLRGTLHVIALAREAHSRHGLRRFSDISTVAVAGLRQNELVSEDRMIEWNQSDYDPYVEQKNSANTWFNNSPRRSAHRFSARDCDGRYRSPETTQFDMVRAFVHLAVSQSFHSKKWQADIVPAHFVSRAVVEIHQKEKPRYDSYNLSSGRASLTYGEILDALASEKLVKTEVFSGRSFLNLFPERFAF